MTLAIETSCDDTSVAILEKHPNSAATLHFHAKITSDNRGTRGIDPIVAHESHQKNLAGLVNEALQSLPPTLSNTGIFVKDGTSSSTLRQKPDFVTATRGPGMRANLITGIDTAKGLAVAWQIPFLGVNHMQAHALTPRLVSALRRKSEIEHSEVDPSFPFLTLLVSGGNTMLVHSKGLCDHKILASTVDIAVGDMIDKAARDILPPATLASSPDVSYGPVLEQYAIPDPETTPPMRANEVPWSISLPMSNGASGNRDSLMRKYTFTGTGSMVRRIILKYPEMQDWERRLLARELMRTAFEHLASRAILWLKNTKQPLGDVSALVISGGVASNQYLMRITREMLDKNGYSSLPLVVPPMKYCTDNAAMIAWTGIEMWEAGLRSNLDAMAMREWSIDPDSQESVGILGATSWRRENEIPWKPLVNNT